MKIYQTLALLSVVLCAVPAIAAPAKKTTLNKTPKKTVEQKLEPVAVLEAYPEPVSFASDTEVLADPIYSIEADYKPLSGELHPTLIQELRRIGKILARFGAVSLDETTARSVSKFVEAEVVDPSVEYVPVNQLPAAKICDDKSVLPGGMVVSQMACSQGKKTFLIFSAFKGLTIRAQALLVTQQRIRARALIKSDADIVPLIEGLNVALGLYDEQLAGKRPVLTQEQVNHLSTLKDKITTLELGHGFIKDVLANGGGLSSSANIAPTSYVSVASLLNDNAKIAPGALVLDSVCVGAKCIIGNNARLVHSYVVNGALDLASGSVVLKSKIDLKTKTNRARTLQLADGARIDESLILSPSFDSTLPDDENPKAQPRTYLIGERAVVLNSQLIRFAQITLGTDALVKDVEITQDETQLNQGFISHLEVGNKASLKSASSHDLMKLCGDFVITGCATMTYKAKTPFYKELCRAPRFAAAPKLADSVEVNVAHEVLRASCK